MNHLEVTQEGKVFLNGERVDRVFEISLDMAGGRGDIGVTMKFAADELTINYSPEDVRRRREERARR